MNTRSQFEVFFEEAAGRGVDTERALPDCEAFFASRRAVKRVPVPYAPHEAWNLKEKFLSASREKPEDVEKLTRIRKKHDAIVAHDKLVKVQKKRALELMELARHKAVLALRGLVIEAKRNAVDEANEILGAMPAPSEVLFAPPPQRVRELQAFGAWADGVLCHELSILGFPGGNRVKPEPSFISMIRPEFVKPGVGEAWFRVIAT